MSDTIINSIYKLWIILNERVMMKMTQLKIACVPILQKHLNEHRKSTVRMQEERTSREQVSDRGSMTWNVWNVATSITQMDMMCV